MQNGGHHPARASKATMLKNGRSRARRARRAWLCSLRSLYLVADFPQVMQFVFFISNRFWLLDFALAYEYKHIHSF